MQTDFVYQLIDTATGEVLESGEVSDENTDRVFFVNWDNYDGVDPFKLYRRTKKQRYELLDISHFDSRMTLESKWSLDEPGLSKILEELVRVGAESLSSFRPAEQVTLPRHHAE